MRLLSYRREGVASCGYLEGSTVVDLGDRWPTLAALLAGGGLDSLGGVDGERLQLDELELLPPIPHPGKILCAGFNFLAHTTEAGGPGEDEPTLFVRFADSFVGHGTPVERPAASVQLDWEGELAVVIGAPARRISRAEALDCVAGYTCVAENSVRDWQAHGTQATAGKNFHRSGAMGPWLTTADEVAELESLRLTTRLNGEVMQRAELSELVHPIADLLAYVTTFTPLAPGDVVATGTPAGTGFRRKPQRFLAPGDVLEVDIPGVGCLVNGVIDAS